MGSVVGSALFGLRGGPVAKLAVTLSAALLFTGCDPARGAGAEVKVPAPAGSEAATEDASARICPAGMAFLAKGKLLMGVDPNEEEAMPESAPQHMVEVGAFCLAKNETTVAEYEQCVKAGDCTPELERRLHDECNTGRSDKANHPVNCVDFKQATRYCESRGLRLPTEDEWEFAARGVVGRKYPWGDAALDPTRLNACDGSCMRLIPNNGFMFEVDDGFAMTAPVGSFPRGATPEGIQDMAGNVAEWTSSPDCPAPGQPCTSENRMIRGAAWDSWFFASAQGAFRGSSSREPSTQLSEIGFRCAKSATLPR